MSDETQVASTGETLVGEVQTAANIPEGAVSAASTASGLSELLAEDLRSDKTLTKFTNVNELAKSYKHLNSMIGKRMTELSKEDLQMVYNNLGRPEKADDYKFAEDLKDTDIAWYKAAAHEAGLTQEQAKVVADKYVEIARQAQKDAEVAKQLELEETVETLKKEFGNAYDQRLKLAQKAVKEFGGEELINILNKTGLGNNKEVIKAFAKIGKEMMEDTIIKGDSEATFGFTPEEANAQAKVLMKDPAYFNNRDPRHKSVVAEVHRLRGLTPTDTSSVKLV